MQAWRWIPFRNCKSVGHRLSCSRILIFVCCVYSLFFQGLIGQPDRVFRRRVPETHPSVRAELDSSMKKSVCCADSCTFSFVAFAGGYRRIGCPRSHPLCRSTLVSKNCTTQLFATADRSSMLTGFVTCISCVSLRERRWLNNNSISEVTESHGMETVKSMYDTLAVSNHACALAHEIGSNANSLSPSCRCRYFTHNQISRFEAYFPNLEFLYGSPQLAVFLRLCAHTDTSCFVPPQRHGG